MSPISQRSTAAAQDRPSAIAQTIRLCPLVMSPQTNTPSRLVAQLESHATFPLASSSSPSSETTPMRSAPTKPIAISTSSQAISSVDDGNELEPDPSVLDDLADLVRSQSRDGSGPVVHELGRLDRVDAITALFVRRRRPHDERPGRPRVVSARPSGG